MVDTRAQPAPDLLLALQAHQGGVEALLAASDLIQMYTRYVLRQGWTLACLEADAPAPGQVRRAAYAITGADAGARLRHELGIHRVQRLSLEAPLRRVHTATVIVQVAPPAGLAPPIGSGAVAPDVAQAPPLALPKVRTYNYAENRATDHRLGRSFPALPLLLDGDLDPLIEALEQGGFGDR